MYSTWNIGGIIQQAFSTLEKVIELEVYICKVFSPVRVASPLNISSACEKSIRLRPQAKWVRETHIPACRLVLWAGTTQEKEKKPGIYSAVSLSRSLQISGNTALRGAWQCKGANSPWRHSHTAGLKPSVDFPGRGFFTGGKSQAALPLLQFPQLREQLAMEKSCWWACGW